MRRIHEFVLSVACKNRSEGVEKVRFLINAIEIKTGCLALIALLAVSCNAPTSTSDSNVSATATVASATAQFAGGQKGVKIYTSVSLTSTPPGSFAALTATPTPAVIPSPFPGYDGSSSYLPGVSPTTFYNLDDTVGTKPSWLLDFQLGVTSKTPSSACATFGGSGSAGGTTGALSLDTQDLYRVSESNCTGINGSGTPVDPVFIRIVLDRTTTQIGSSENLLMQIEYQSSGVHFNSDGSNVDPEKNVDQLWKIFWDTTLGPGYSPKAFATFIPPDLSACVETGTGDAASLGGLTNNCASSTYKGSPTKTRQFIIPLSAYPTMRVIQISRVKGRSDTPTTNYINGSGTTKFCGTDDPLCAGVVIHSVSLMRM